MILLSFWIAAALVPAQPSDPAAALLRALASNDLAAARATLAPDVMFMDGSNPSSSLSLDSFAASIRDCRQTDRSSEADRDEPSRTAVTVTWTCPARGSAQTFIWTSGAKVVAVQYEAVPS